MDFTYYGRNDGSKPKTEVVDMMLDEHLRKLMDYEQRVFRDSLRNFMKEYKVECRVELVKLRKDVKALANRLNAMDATIKKRPRSKPKGEKHVNNGI